jgi:hypothetical protein
VHEPSWLFHGAGTIQCEEGTSRLAENSCSSSNYREWRPKRVLDASFLLPTSTFSRHMNHLHTLSNHFCRRDKTNHENSQGNTCVLASGSLFLRNQGILLTEQQAEGETEVQNEISSANHRMNPRYKIKGIARAKCSKKGDQTRSKVT